MAVRLIPAAEIPEALAWFLLPFAALGLALWALRALAERRRANRFAAENARIEEQAREERATARRQGRRP